jgi:hypothetical protein
MNALFHLLSDEEYAKLNLGQKMVYLHALAADLREQLEAATRESEPRQDMTRVSLVRR